MSTCSPRSTASSTIRVCDRRSLAVTFIRRLPVSVHFEVYTTLPAGVSRNHSTPIRSLRPVLAVAATVLVVLLLVWVGYPAAVAALAALRPPRPLPPPVGELPRVSVV